MFICDNKTTEQSIKVKLAKYSTSRKLHKAHYLVQQMYDELVFRLSRARTTSFPVESHKK